MPSTSALWRTASQLATNRYPGRTLLAHRAMSIGDDAVRASRLEQIDTQIPVIADAITMGWVAGALDRLAPSRDPGAYRYETRLLTLRIIVAVHPATPAEDRSHVLWDLEQVSQPYDQNGNRLVISHPRDASEIRAARTVGEHVLRGDVANLPVPTMRPLDTTARFADYLAAHVATAMTACGVRGLDEATQRTLTELAPTFRGTLGDLLVSAVAVSGP